MAENEVTKDKGQKARRTEIDLLRTLAIAGMIAYHAAYDLRVYHGLGIDPFSLPMIAAARAVAILFLLLAGVGFALGGGTVAPASVVWRKALRRALVVGVGAATVSAATYLADPDTVVRFGILHLIAAASLLLPLARGARGWLLPIGIAWAALGVAITGSAESAILLPLGWIPAGFRSVDYFPLLPWFGAILAGAGIGHLLYVRHPLPPLLQHPSWRALGWPGRHSLAIYLLHQPILLLALRLTLGSTY